MFYAASASSPGGGRDSFLGGLARRPPTAQQHGWSDMPLVASTVGWGVHRVSIEKLDYSFANDFAFVEGFCISTTYIRSKNLPISLESRSAFVTWCAILQLSALLHPFG